MLLSETKPKLQQVLEELVYGGLSFPFNQQTQVVQTIQAMSICPLCNKFSNSEKMSESRNMLVGA